MHWFDGFVKSIGSEKTPRRAALGTIGLVAGAASLPWTKSAGAVAATVGNGPRRVVGPHQRHSGTPSLAHAPLRAKRGAVRELLNVPASFHSGKCTFGHKGPQTSFGYETATTSAGQKVELTVSHHTVVSGEEHLLTATQTDTLEVKADGALVVRVEALHHANNQSSSSHAGTITFTYGAAVRGVTGAKFTFSGSSISGSVDRSSSTAKPGGTRYKTLSAQFAKNIEPVPLSIDSGLHATIGTLFARFGTERQTCSARPHRLQRVSRHAPAWVSDRASFLRARGGRRELAQANGQLGGDAGVELQNSYGAPSTPNCTSCMNSAASQMAGCWESVGLDLLFGCAPCLLAQIQCQAEATAAALGCWIPGAGCMQTICGVGTSCDSQDACCGSDCCTGSEVCLHGKNVCCPPGYSEACAGSSGFPFCCQTGDVCCGNDLCCPQGSVCCGHDCCPAGSTCCGNSCCYGDSVCVDAASTMCCGKGESKCGDYCCASSSMCINGQCCSLFCGDECCPYGACENGKCVPYTFGTPSPKPAPAASGHRIGVSTCTPGLYACQSLFKNGTTTDICCGAGINCCAGQCCPPGLYCGGPGEELSCGNWIK